MLYGKQLLCGIENETVSEQVLTEAGVKISHLGRTAMKMEEAAKYQATAKPHLVCITNALDIYLLRTENKHFTSVPLLWETELRGRQLEPHTEICGSIQQTQLFPHKGKNRGSLIHQFGDNNLPSAENITCELFN